jgi:hypothetical protein
LTKDGPRVVECFVSGEKFEFNYAYEEQDDYMEFYDTILKPNIEKFIQGQNVSVVTNYSHADKQKISNFKEYNVFENILKVVQHYFDSLKKTEKTLDFTFYDVEFSKKNDFTLSLSKHLESNRMASPNSLSNDKIKLISDHINQTISSDLSIFKITLKRPLPPPHLANTSTLTIGFIKPTCSPSSPSSPLAPPNPTPNPQQLNLTNLLIEYSNKRERLKNISNELKIFFHEVLIGCP